MTKSSHKDKIFIALDVATLHEAQALITTLGDAGQAYKIGYQLAMAGGIGLAKEIASEGKTIFLDMKLHDIGHTIQQATENVARLGVNFLTVHAYPQTLKAAVAGAKGSELKILAVTVLTSYDTQDVQELGFTLNVQELFALRAKQALACGADGLILSPQELAQGRALMGHDKLLVTPGIRPAGDEKGDQKRVLTPREAFQQGADYLVIGRPITAAKDPKAAMQAILASL